MTNLEKKEIRRLVKITGSHINTVKAGIIEKFNISFTDKDIEYTEEQINKKFTNIKPKLRAGIRF